ncbi:MAG TPA: DNA primase [Chitinophagales bacterium]|nr:DNA primase [Chitinophagales bacterium]
MISARSKEEILSAARIEEVIGEYVNLKRRGTNFIGLCPFHTEKTPSFNVSPTKGIFKCFGCGKAGDVITFLIEHEKFTYPEALRFLAQKYHIAIEETGDINKEQEDKLVKESLYIINQFAQEYYHNNLYKTEEGQTVGYSYFKERGITDEMIRKFKLGYALQISNSFTIAALKGGYQLELLKKAGLIVTKGSSDMDFFHHRVMFPIMNVSGKVVAFAGRIMVKDEKSPKYINSPETEICKKSQLVYGIFHAKNAIRQHDECFLTEGYTDVISMHMAGMENVVASSGTSLTEDQIKLVKRFTNNITILYDGDPAGIKAALRGLEMMASQDVNIRVALLPDGDDPDSFLHKNGSAALRDFIRDNKKDFIRFKVELLLADAGDDPLKRADVIREVVNTLGTIPDAIKRSVLIRECSKMLAVDEQILTIEVNKLKRKQFRKETGAEKFEADTLHQSAEQLPDHSEQLIKKSGDELQERDIIRLLLEFGKEMMNETTTVAEYILDDVKDVALNNVIYRMMLHEVESQIESGNIPDHHYFLQQPDEEMKKLAMEIISSPYSLSENWNKMHDIYVTMPTENFRNDVISSLNHFKLKKVITMMKENLKELKSVSGKEEDEKHYLHVHSKLTDWKKQLGKRMGAVVVN